MVLSWIRRALRGTPQPATRLKRSTFRPRLEALEERVVPAVVMNANDTGDGSLRAVIGAAQNGDTITFDPSLQGQTITLNSEIAFQNNLTINGGDRNITLSGNNTNRIFDITYSGSGDPPLDTINNLTFIKGRSRNTDPDTWHGRGGAIFTSGTLSLATIPSVTTRLTTRVELFPH